MRKNRESNNEKKRKKINNKNNNRSQWPFDIFAFILMKMDEKWGEKCN